MNNSERFYYETDFAIKLMYLFLSNDTKNYEYQAKKLIQTIEQCNISLDSFRFSLTSLIDITSFALNKEKIENQANLDWDNYKAELTSKMKNFGQRFSKIPYLKEWCQVRDCSQKYISESAQFWIKKIRNSFLHGKFELDYSKQSPLSEIIIKQGSTTKTDIDIKLFLPGLTEFIEDNFRNIYSSDFGIKKDYNFLKYPNIDITNTQTLEEYLSKIAVYKYKINYDNLTYNGNELVSPDGEQLKPVIAIKQHLDDPTSPPVVPKFMEESDNVCCLKPEKAHLLAKLIEKKAGHIYHDGKKQKIVHKYLSNYLFPFDMFNSLLHEITHAINYIYFALNLKIIPKSDYKKSFSIIKFGEENLKPTFTLLQLYRLLYRMQNDNFKPIDYSKLDCEKLFFAVTPDLVSEKIKTNTNKYPSLTEKELINKTYLEILRDALAHGNVDFQTYFSEDADTVDRMFTFTDSWTYKDGRHTDTIIKTNISSLEYLFTEIDKDLEFMPYNDCNV